MRKLWSTRGKILGLALGTVLALPVSAPLQAQEVSFKGKQVTMIISSTPGGGTDMLGRLIGLAMTKYLPDQPNFLYRNDGGAGGINALNRFYVETPPDGLTIFTGAANQLNPINLSRPQIKYDPSRLELFGGLSNASEFLLIRGTAIKQLTERGAPVTVAEVDGLRAGSMMALWGADYLGWNIKMVVGYQGTAAMMLALQRGEVDMASNNNLEVIKPIVDKKEALFLVQTGTLNKGKVVPSRVYPEVPIFANQIESKLSGLPLEVFRAWEHQAHLGKWYALPPGTPKAYVAAWREAFTKAANDPQFREVAVSKIDPDIEEVPVQALDKMFQNLTDAGKNAAVVQYFDELAKKHR